MTDITGDPLTGPGSRASTEPQDASPPSASIPIADAKCPHCGGILNMSLVSQLTAESRVKWKIYPKPGEFMNARTVGGTLVDVEKLLKAVAKDQGVRAEILVVGVTSGEDSSITFDLAISRFEKGFRPAQGIDARSGETGEDGLDLKGKSPVGNADAPKDSAPIAEMLKEESLP